MQRFILKRKQISTKLNSIFAYPLTIIVAAMGYGKTTSVRDFLDQADKNYIWLTVGSDESSPQYIWDSLTRQLIKAVPKLGRQLNTLGFPINTPQRDKVIKIIEDYTALVNTIIVIDDYHFNQAYELNQMLEIIVRARIQGLHIVILSRTIPEINVDELTLKGYCYLLKHHLFELSQEEVKQYFLLNGHSISDDIAQRVHKISEGWISAVYLMMQRYSEIGIVESGSSIEKLIETAVIPRYSEKELMILKLLSVFDSFTPDQAVYVTNDAATERIIQDISNGNSFIRYDEKEGVYRIHNIFKSYLKKLIEQQPLEIARKELHKKAGIWYIDNEDIVLGLKHFLIAHEYDLVMGEFEKSSINLVLDNHSKFILEIFKYIPSEVRYRHPIGYLAYTSFYVTNVDKEEGFRLLVEIDTYYQDDTNISAHMKKRINGEIELIRAYAEFNDAALMHHKLAKAHELLDGRSSIANKDKIITFGSTHSLYLYYKEKGKLLATMRTVEQMFPYYMDLAGGCGKGFDNLLKAEYYLETGDLKRAEIEAHKAILKAKTMEQIAVIICADLVLARVCAARGQFDKSQEIIDQLNTEVETSNSPILSSAFDLCAGYIGGITGKERNFADWLKIGDLQQCEILYQGIGFNYLIYGKYLLLNKSYLQLEILCEDMRGAFSLFNNQLGFLHCYILEAAAKYRLYGMTEAKTAMLLALEIGKADDIVLPFAEYDADVLVILKELQKDAKKSTTIDSYMNRLVLVVTKIYSKRDELTDIKSPPLLTEREQEILKHIIEGRTNQEIAAHIFIAEVTVRKNITSIYRKLNVSGRAAAVKKALDFKLIPDYS
ncbi:MAG: hypothetical protein APF84_03435 [Gracilibacter sp. BRH_c7a]|nr:MAG: hypothetical protein APF84_03435 [Gracilibacter sp. BRH_c7a]